MHRRGRSDTRLPRLLFLAVPHLALAAWRRQGPTRVEVPSHSGRRAARGPARSAAARAREDAVRGPWEAGVESGALCGELRRLLRMKRCRRDSPARVLRQPVEFARAQPTGRWPMQRCSMPMPLPPSYTDTRTPCGTVSFAASATGVEQLWPSLPSGGVIVVPLQHNSSQVQQDRLVWQALYQLNSRMFYSEFHDMKAPDLDLPNLQFASFVAGFALLQKADWDRDIDVAQGRFHSLANVLQSDKISVEHNYSLLYHRLLDTGKLKDRKGGMMLGIGAGCTVNGGLGESPKFWPRFFKHLAVHLLRGESERLCLARWMDRIHSQGVAKVHIGDTSQVGRSNPLIGITKDVVHTGPVGLQAVVDSDEGGSAETEASFRGLFPEMAPGGLYFLENIMRATWGGPSGMPLLWKHSRVAASPLALAATMATAAAGVCDWAHADSESAKAALEQLHNEERPAELWSQPLRWASGLLQRARARVVGISEKERVESINHEARVWYEDLILSRGRMVDFVECSPGVCAIRRK